MNSGQHTAGVMTHRNQKGEQSFTPWDQAESVTNSAQGTGQKLHMKVPEELKN